MAKHVALTFLWCEPHLPDTPPAPNRHCLNRRRHPRPRTLPTTWAGRTLPTTLSEASDSDSKAAVPRGESSSRTAAREASFLDAGSRWHLRRLRSQRAVHLVTFECECSLQIAGACQVVYPSCHYAILCNFGHQQVLETRFLRIRKELKRHCSQ